MSYSAGFAKESEAEFYASLCGFKAGRGNLLFWRKYSYWASSFSKDNKELCCFCVDPLFRNKEIAALCFYKSLGFIKSSFTETFGYPCMIMSYTV